MEDLKEEKLAPPEKWGKTFLACGGAITILVFNGVVEAHSSVLLPQLKEDYSPIKNVTKDEETWIASLGIFASPLSAILCGPLADYFGRKIIIECYFLISAIGYGIIAAASSVFHLYIGRIICSLGVGFEVAAIIYIAEVCTKHQRSFFLSLTLPMFCGGILFTYLVGAVVPWNIGSAIYALLCLLLFLYECFTPESPPWLVKKGKTDRAVAEFKRLGRSEANIEEEIRILKASCEEEAKQRVEWRTFLQPTVWKPFLIIATFHFLQAATGIYDLLYYTVDFVDALGTGYDAYTVSTGLAIGRFLMTSTVGLYFTTKVRRKKATALSGFSMGVTLLITAAYEYQYHGVPPSQRANTWIPILSIFASVLVSAAGVLHLPWLMSGEVFPLQVRGAMSGAVFFVGSCSMFLFLKYYVFFISTFAVTGTLLLCAAASVIIGAFGLFVLTETQGKSLYEIEEGYKPKKTLRGVDLEKTML